MKCGKVDTLNLETATVHETEQLKTRGSNVGPRV